MDSASRHLCRSVVTGLICALLAPFVVAKPLNVLFLMADDMRPDLGAYGNPIVHTPNLDRLAAASLRFERAYVQYPLCNPSRTSMLTGRHPTATGVLGNRTWFGAAHPDWISLPKFFKQQGYASLRTGKIFHGGIDDDTAWTEGGEKRKFSGAVDAQRPGQDPKRSDRLIRLDGEGESHADWRIADRAIDYLERHKDKPFFIACGFTRPHSPLTAPGKMFDRLDVARIPLPVDFQHVPTTPPGFPPLAVPARSGDLFIGRQASDAEAREYIRAYWASCSFVDAQVGRVLAALDRLGLRDNTVVLFWGDHGYHLGEKGKWSKHNSLFEIGTRIPLMIQAPGAKGNGKVARQIVQMIDIYPTLAELCALPAPAGLQGESLALLLRDPGAPRDTPAFSVCLINGVLGRAVRTARWRYAEWDEGAKGAMLFDEARDPHELKNLAEDKAHAPVVAEMKALLKRLPPRE
ncbi:MAG: sulfatase [Verrucomicrobia bacterium]|nr:sulfatase [Verrucomicrobiota bacterium]